MGLIIVEKGNKEDFGARFVISENTVIIGRGTPENSPDIGLHDECISRRHAEIIYRDSNFYLRDLRSTNGTTIDNQRIEADKFYPLKQDSIIGLGIAQQGARIVLRFKVNTTTPIESCLDKESFTGSWLCIDEERDEIRVDNKLINLPRKEFDLLLCLYHNAGKVCPKDEIIAKVWPEVIDPGGVSDAAIDQLIHRLRMKIESDPSQPKRLLSRKGFGYMLLL